MKEKTKNLNEHHEGDLKRMSSKIENLSASETQLKLEVIFLAILWGHGQSETLHFSNIIAFTGTDTKTNSNRSCEEQGGYWNQMPTEDIWYSCLNGET